MRWLSLLAGCVAVCLVILAGRAWAQNAPDAPSITQVFPGTNRIDVFWSAPASDGGTAIAAYDLRYIRSDAADKADAGWTVLEDAWTTATPALVGEITGLPDGTRYDVQVRADNGTEGPWSATREVTTTEHGKSRSSATLLSLGSSVHGSIDPASEADYFRVVLATAGDLWVYTTGSDDTVGELQRSNGSLVATGDDGELLDGPLNFSIRAELQPGTYYVKVTGFEDDETALYTLHARVVTDPGSTKDAAITVELDSVTGGRIGPKVGVDGDQDYFKLVLSEAADVWVMAVGDVDTYGYLLDDQDMALEVDDDSEYPGNEQGFMLRRELTAGTYYILVTGHSDDDTGPYALFVRTATDPGSSTATATPLVLEGPETGRIRPATDQDYFSLTLDEEMYVYMYALSFGGALPLTPTVTDSTNTAVTGLHVIAHEHWNHNGLPEASFSVWGKYPAGTYYIRVAAPSSGTGGPYLLHAIESSYGPVEERCTGITTAQTDPWYGCQWHLNNTRQFPGGAGQDINVEEVWATTMGAGINVAIVDDGLHYAHEDLSPNVTTARNHDYYGSDVYDPLERHGTQVAGIIAARDNDLGVRGVAPRASIYAYNLIDVNTFAAADTADAMTRNMSDTAVNNSSWGPQEMIGFTSSSWEAAIVNGVTNGFGGKGVFYVFSAGNNYRLGQDGTLDEYANHYGVTAVCSVNYNDVRASNSETGPHLWVCAPSDDTGAPDLPGIATTRNGSRYTDSFGGTSAAAPMVSGVAALVRATNTDLTWRDVKLILAASARKNDSSSRGTERPYRGWETGANKYGATGRYQYNHGYGFGVVDAGAAVALAGDWTNVPELREIEVESGDINLVLPDAPAFAQGTTLTSSLTVDSWVGFVEFVEINVTFDHPSFRDVYVQLISPSGARSILSRGIRATVTSSDGTVTKQTDALTQRFRLGSARHLGEDAAGTWTLRVSDEVPDDVGTLQSWSIKFYGHGFTPAAPAVTTTAVDRALAVEWTEPAVTGGFDITSYDVRYIQPSATNPSWRVVRNAWRTGGGDLRYVIRGLTNDEYYQVQVRAVNAQGVGRWSDRVDGKAEAGNTAAEFPDAETGERSVDENTPAGRNVGAPVAARDDDNDARTYTLTGAAADFFDIVTGTGQLRTREPLNHEDRTTYAGVVSVTDGKDVDGNDDPAIDNTISITITIDDVDEPPVITGDAAFDIEEGSGTFVGLYSASDPEGQAVGLSLTGSDARHFEFPNGSLEFRLAPDFERESAYRVTVEATDGRLESTLAVTVNVENVEELGTVALSSATPQEGTRFTASLTDPDGRISGLAWTWERSLDGSTSWSTIDGVTGASYTPVTGDVGQYLRATASYADGHGAGKSAAARSAHAVRAAPLTNRRPDFGASETGERSVAENTTGGAPIGAPVAAADDDAADTLTYTLDRTGATFFDIDRESGQLRTRAPLDRESRSSYRVTVIAADPSLARVSVSVTITVEDVDEDPELSGASVFAFAGGSTSPVGRFTATDPERAAITWSLSGLDDTLFSITGGTLAFLEPPDFDAPGGVRGDNVYEVTVTAADPAGNSDSIDVSIRVTEAAEARLPSVGIPFIFAGGFAPAAPSGPTPSDEDFHWTVEQDIEELDGGNDRGTGMWSDGTTLWIADNAQGAGDAVYAYDRESGERTEDLEFPLHETNLAPRGLWSDGSVVWVSDSGKDRLFAYDLETGERLEDREVELDRRNRDARGIWSDGATMWVLEDRYDALFAYDLESGELIAEYELDDSNSSPHGLWSDRVTIWVSNHDPKRLFAYRLPTREEAERVGHDEPGALERVPGEDFARLSRASNNSPRGLWSDGAVMYVVDESDDRVYTYNMPDAVDASLASLTLSGVDIGEFTPRRTEYAAEAARAVTVTTVEALATQSDATVVITPSDADEETDGRQVALGGDVEVTVTVTSPDGSRQRVYRVLVAGAGPSASCLRGAVHAGFSLVVFEGGGIDDLVECAQARGVSALYTLRDGAYVSYVVGAPDIVNARFRGLFPDGVPALLPLVVRSESPVNDGPRAAPVTEPFAVCLRGDIARGFSLVLYEGGSVDELAVCAEGLGVAAVYALAGGEYVQYIVGAPEFVNESFRRLFADGIPPATPLTARSEETPGN